MLRGTTMRIRNQAFFDLLDRRIKILAICVLCQGKVLPLHVSNIKSSRIMEEKKFKNRREQADWIAKQRGWGPLTEEDKIALDDAVRLITSLDSKPRYATVSH